MFQTDSFSVDDLLSLLKAPLLGPSDLKLHNMDDIFCYFAGLHLVGYHST